MRTSLNSAVVKETYVCRRLGLREGQEAGNGLRLVRQRGAAYDPGIC